MLKARGISLILLVCYFLIAIEGCTPGEGPPAAFGVQASTAAESINDSSESEDFYAIAGLNKTGDMESDRNQCQIISVRVLAAPAGNPLARQLAVFTDSPCSITGYVWSDELSGYGVSQAGVSPGVREYRLWFYGLAEDMYFKYTIRLTDRPQIELGRGKFFVPALPVGTPRPVYVGNTGWADDSLWVVMFFPMTANAGSNSGVLMMLDREGRLRFYHHTPAVQVGAGPSYSALTRMSDGSLVIDDTQNVYSINQIGAEKLIFAPQLNDPFLFPMHHQSYIADDLSRAWLLFNSIGSGTECDGVTPADNVVGDGVAEIDTTGKEVWRWSAFDHQDKIPPNATDPEECAWLGGFWGPDTVDWTHGNSVYKIPNENAFLLSLRNASRIVKIDRDTGEIVWQMGEGLDFSWEDRAPDQEWWFHFQHDAQQLPNGNIILFDNQFHYYNGLWSRAMELEVDEQNMQIELVWEYFVPFTIAHGSVERLDNGNTLISTGNSLSIFEASPDGWTIWWANLPTNVGIPTLAKALVYPALWNMDGE